MKNSIQFKLTLACTALFTLVAGIAGGVSFYDTYRETYKLQDDLLVQLSSFIDISETTSSYHSNRDNSARIFVHFERLNKRIDTQATDFPKQMEEGFHTLKKEGRKYKKINSRKENRLWFMLKNADDSYRTYVRNTPNGKIIVTQDNDYREDLAIRSAWRSILPLLILLPLVILFTILIIRLAMKPVDRLSRKVEKRHEQNLTPLSTEKIPSEIRGFVIEINRLLERTNNFIQQQKRFIADAAHELRSPMTALSLQIDLLANQNLPTEVQNQIFQVQQGIQRNRNLLEQLLSLARIQNSATQHYNDFNIQGTFRRVIEDLLPLALEKNQDLGVTTNQPVYFHGSETDLYLLIKTLVDNAIRYTQENSQIDLSVQHVKNEIIIQIEDNGKGIPKEERERVLDPFYRILGTEQQGSGLGLAIANEIVHQYAGKIMLKESINFEHGLLVEIRLPIKDNIKT